LESGIPALDDAPVFERLDTLIGYVSKAIPSHTKVGPIMRHLAEDMTEEIRAFPPEVVEVYIQYFASMMFWVAKGYAPEDFPLPPDFETGQKAIEG
jgi:hypothetical protein